MILHLLNIKLRTHWFLLDIVPSKLDRVLQLHFNMVGNKELHFVPILAYKSKVFHDLYHSATLHMKARYQSYQLDSLVSRDSIQHYGNSLHILDTKVLPIYHTLHI